jgi:hypothetical protein
LNEFQPSNGGRKILTYSNIPAALCTSVVGASFTPMAAAMELPSSAFAHLVPMCIYLSSNHLLNPGLGRRLVWRITWCSFSTKKSIAAFDIP